VESDPHESKRMRYFKPMVLWACVWTAISFSDRYIPSPWIYIGLIPAALTIWYAVKYFRMLRQYPPPKKGK
jgi:hypothetical protein